LFPQGQDIVDVTVGEVGKQVTLICFENTKINLAKSFREIKPTREKQLYHSSEETKEW